MYATVRSALVTGGAGCIGSFLVEELVHRGVDTTVVDDLSTGYLNNLGRVQAIIQFIRADVASPTWPEQLGGRTFDLVVHLAANAYVPPSIENPFDDFQRNVVGTLRVLEWVRLRNPEARLLVASSAAVYGDPAITPTPESCPLRPISPYGAGKAAVEQYIGAYSAVYGLQASAMRFFSCYGPRMRKQVFFDLTRRLLLNPHQLTVFGNGEVTRDFIYVEDLVAAVLALAERGQFDGRQYNVASGIERRISQVATGIAAALGFMPEISYTGSVRPGDPLHWAADIARLRETGFVPRFGLDEGIRRTVDWIRETEAAFAQ